MANESRVAVVHRVCAWCREEFARETWCEERQADVTTWGICRRCLEPRLNDDAPCREVSWEGCTKARHRGIAAAATHSAALARWGSG
jgi:predicted amidophosphoribosyltransferase